ncbi:MAG: dephospho-CoA kinase [Muribaculaceae bacterium]|nr:dephospho-CoA kinase [Muribaculaceae bacterium]
MLIGITGGIGAGKSVVSRILRLKGYPVYDCDLRARELMDNSSEIKSALCDRLGAAALKPDGSIDRSFIASKVFASDDDRLWLNRLVHGAVREDLGLWTDRQEGDLCFVESAIMVSSGLDKMCDTIWLVDAPVEIRMRRAVARGGATAENIALRIEAQKGEFELLPEGKTVKILNADNGSLLRQIDLKLESFMLS